MSVSDKAMRDANLEILSETLIKDVGKHHYDESARLRGQDKQPSPAICKENVDSVQVGGTHYKDMAMQPWEVMEAMLTKEEFVGYLKGSIIKYVMRDGRKPGANDDQNKAKHYIAKLKSILERTKW
jgi:hypothetical protein